MASATSSQQKKCNNEEKNPIGKTHIQERNIQSSFEYVHMTPWIYKRNVKAKRRGNKITWTLSDLRFSVHNRRWVVAFSGEILLDWRWLITENVMHQFDLLPLAVGELNQLIFAHFSRAIGGQHEMQHIRADAQHFAAAQEVLSKDRADGTTDRATHYQQRGVVDPDACLRVLRRQVIDGVSVKFSAALELSREWIDEA